MAAKRNYNLTLPKGYAPPGHNSPVDHFLSELSRQTGAKKIGPATYKWALKVVGSFAEAKRRYPDSFIGENLKFQVKKTGGKTSVHMTTNTSGIPAAEWDGIRALNEVPGFERVAKAVPVRPKLQPTGMLSSLAATIPTTPKAAAKLYGGEAKALAKRTPFDRKKGFVKNAEALGANAAKGLAAMPVGIANLMGEAYQAVPKRIGYDVAGAFRQGDKAYAKRQAAVDKQADAITQGVGNAVGGFLTKTVPNVAKAAVRNPKAIPGKLAEAAFENPFETATILMPGVKAARALSAAAKAGEAADFIAGGIGRAATGLGENAVPLGAKAATRAVEKVGLGEAAAKAGDTVRAAKAKVVDTTATPGATGVDTLAGANVNQSRQDMARAFKPVKDAMKGATAAELKTAARARAGYDVPEPAMTPKVKDILRATKSSLDPYLSENIDPLTRWTREYTQYKLVNPGKADDLLLARLREAEPQLYEQAMAQKARQAAAAGGTVADTTHTALPSRGLAVTEPGGGVAVNDAGPEVFHGYYPGARGKADADALLNQALEEGHIQKTGPGRYEPVTKSGKEILREADAILGKNPPKYVPPAGTKNPVPGFEKQFSTGAHFADDGGRLDFQTDFMRRTQGEARARLVRGLREDAARIHGVKVPDGETPPYGWEFLPDSAGLEAKAGETLPSTPPDATDRAHVADILGITEDTTDLAPIARGVARIEPGVPPATNVPAVMGNGAEASTGVAAGGDRVAVPSPVARRMEENLAALRPGPMRRATSFYKGGVVSGVGSGFGLRTLKNHGMGVLSTGGLRGVSPLGLRGLLNYINPETRGAIPEWLGYGGHGDSPFGELATPATPATKFGKVLGALASGGATAPGLSKVSDFFGGATTGVDNAVRGSAYLDTLRGWGFTPEDIRAGLPRDVQLAAAQAANQSIGGYTSLTPWEKGSAINVLPFYAPLKQSVLNVVEPATGRRGGIGALNYWLARGAANVGTDVRGQLMQGIDPTGTYDERTHGWQETAIPTPTGEPGGFTMDTPFPSHMAGAAETITDPRQLLWQSGPTISAALSYLTHTNPLTGADFTSPDILSINGRMVDRETGLPAEAPYPAISRIVGGAVPGLNYIQRAKDAGRIAYDTSPYASGPYRTGRDGKPLMRGTPATQRLIPTDPAETVRYLLGLPAQFYSAIDPEGPPYDPTRGVESPYQLRTRLRWNALDSARPQP